jgi:hypothetical protein
MKVGMLIRLPAEAKKAPRDQEVRFRVALAGTLRLDVLNIAIAERNPKVSMVNKTWQQSSHSSFVRGAFYGLAAVSIWAAFIIVSRLGARTSLMPWDVAATRFGTAGLLLLPYLMKRGLALDRLGWIGLAAISRHPVRRGGGF